MKNRFFFLFILIFIGLRVYFTINYSQFGPDEGMFALKARQLISCIGTPSRIVTDQFSKSYIDKNVQPCGIVPLVGLEGRLGIPYGPYPTYWLALLNWITRFNTRLILILNSILFLIPAFLLATCIKEKRMKKWIFLLSLTSPLFVTYSLQSFWDTPWLLILSSVLLYTAIKKRQSILTSILLGILLGISLASHLQSLPFVIGFIIWYIILLKSKKLITPLMISLLVTVVPYIFGVYILRHITNFQQYLSVPFSWNALILLPAIILRFWGNENTYILYSKIGLLFIFLISFYRNQKDTIFFNNPLYSLIIILIPLQLFFSFYTRTYAEVQESMMMWFISPFIIPYFIFKIIPKFASIALSFFIIINMVVIIQSQLNAKNSMNIWKVKNISDRICGTILENGSKMRPYEVDNRYTQQSLLGMIALQYPECLSNLTLKIRSEAF